MGGISGKKEGEIMDTGYNLHIDKNTKKFKDYVKLGECHMSAKGLAGWLHFTFGLNCFIDSCVWGYSDKLLDKINDVYSDKQDKPTGGCIYDHKKCNTASKHVNTMLTIALHKMIDKAEVTFLLNTDNVISKYSDIQKIN